MTLHRRISMEQCVLCIRALSNRPAQHRGFEKKTSSQYSHKTNTLFLVQGKICCALWSLMIEPEDAAAEIRWAERATIVPHPCVFRRHLMGAKKHYISKTLRCPSAHSTHLQCKCMTELRSYFWLHEYAAAASVSMHYTLFQKRYSIIYVTITFRNCTK